LIQAKDPTPGLIGQGCGRTSSSLIRYLTQTPNQPIPSLILRLFLSFQVAVETGLNHRRFAALGCAGRRLQIARTPLLLSLSLDLSLSLSLCSFTGLVAVAGCRSSSTLRSLSLSLVVVGLTVVGEEEKKLSYERDGGCSGERGSREGEEEKLAYNYQITPPFLFFLLQAV